MPTGIKTTGGKGLHLVSPIERRGDQERLRAAATRLTEIVADRRPDLVTDSFRKAGRKGRVLLDPSRNGVGATIVAPYSPRLRADAAVSFPVAVDELSSVGPPTSRCDGPRPPRSSRSEAVAGARERALGGDASRLGLLG